MDDFLNIQSTRQHLRQRRQKQVALGVLLCVFALLIGINIGGDVSVHECMVPIAGVVGAFTAALASELYVISPRRAVSPELIDQELEWLFGKDKVRSVTPLEFVFAQERIRARRAARWRFVLLSIPFWAIIVLMMGSVVGLQQYGELDWAVLPLLVVLLLLVLLVGLFIGAFPTKGMLARREPGALANLALEVHARYGSLMRPNTWYRLSYDGELIEVTEEEALNSKAPSFNTGKNNSSVGIDDLP